MGKRKRKIMKYKMDSYVLDGITFSIRLKGSYDNGTKKYRIIIDEFYWDDVGGLKGWETKKVYDKKFEDINYACAVFQEILDRANKREAGNDLMNKLEEIDDLIDTLLNGNRDNETAQKMKRLLKQAKRIEQENLNVQEQLHKKVQYHQKDSWDWYKQAEYSHQKQKIFRGELQKVCSLSNKGLKGEKDIVQTLTEIKTRTNNILQRKG